MKLCDDFFNVVAVDRRRPRGMLAATVFHTYSLIVDNKSYEGYMYPDDDDWEVLLQGILYCVNVEDERERRLRQALGDAP